MSESKWTKGPWFVNPRLSGSENHHGYRIGSDSLAFYFADVMPIDPSGIQGGANANLMAASPDLYEALAAFMALDKTFLSASDDYLREHSDKSNARDYNPLAEAVLKARAALAKARGE